MLGFLRVVLEILDIRDDFVRAFGVSLVYTQFSSV